MTTGRHITPYPTAACPSRGGSLDVKLSEETLLKIFSYLSATDLARMSSVCSRLGRLAQDPQVSMVQSG